MSGDRHRLPGPLGEEVHRELARLGGGAPGAGSLPELTAAWPAAVGDTIARNAWPARRTRDGTVLVHTSSSTWAHELTRLEQPLLERLGAAAPRSLRFVVGPLPEPGAEPVSTLQQSPPGPTAADRAAGRAIAAAIDDSDLREAVARAASLSLSAARRRRPDRPV
jgi:hypothetical protein